MEGNPSCRGRQLRFTIILPASSAGHVGSKAPKERIDSPAGAYIIALVAAELHVERRLLLSIDSFMHQNALSQIAELEAKIQQLRSSQITELHDQLKLARETVASLESEIAKITGKASHPGASQARQSKGY